MTYCAAWIYNGAACLVADSAITTSGSPRVSESSIGERTFVDCNRTVEEGALKLVDLGEGTIAALAGDARRGYEMLEFLSREIRAGANVPEAITALERSHGPFAEERSVELLLATSSSDGDARIYRWNTMGSFEHSDEFLDVGSGSVELGSYIYRFILDLKEDDTRAWESVDLVAAYLQALTIHVYMLEWSVGGIMAGARSENGETHWASDRLIMPVDGPTLQPSGLISAIFREGVHVVRSSLNNATSFFATTLSAGDVGSAHWTQSIAGQLSTINYVCWVFVDLRERAFSVVFRTSFDKPPRFVQLRQIGSGITEVAISKPLADLLAERRSAYSNTEAPYAISIYYD